MDNKAVVIIAASGRALATSARRGGYLPLVVDWFGDADTLALVAAHACLENGLARGMTADALDAALSAVTDEALKIRGRGRAQLSELPRARGGVGFSPAAGRRNCGGCKPRRARSDEVASVHVSLL